MGATTPKRTKREVKALIAAGRRAERTVQICMRADLAAAMADAERDLMQMERERNADSAALAGDPTATVVAGRIEQLRAEMLDHMVEFRVRALPRRQWTALLADHPPRENNEADKALGVNIDEFTEAMVRTCVVEPELDDDDWELLLGEVLTDATFEILTNACWGVNRRDRDVPFSRAASQIQGTSAPA